MVFSGSVMDDFRSWVLQRYGLGIVLFDFLGSQGFVQRVIDVHALSGKKEMITCDDERPKRKEI